MTTFDLVASDNWLNESFVSQFCSMMKYRERGMDVLGGWIENVRCIEHSSEPSRCAWQQFAPVIAADIDEIILDD